MRVVSGSARGTRLFTPDGLEFRPTLDRVKEAVFSMLTGKSYENVLDLFSGSGAVGIESLSMGAESCTFVDKSRHSLSVTQKNLDKTHLLDKAQIVLSDYESFIKKNTKKFDLVFLDPPYREGLLFTALCLLKEKSLSDGATVVCEMDDKLKCEIPEGYLAVRDKKYGRCRVFVLEKNF